MNGCPRLAANVRCQNAGPEPAGGRYSMRTYCAFPVLTGSRLVDGALRGSGVEVAVEFRSRTLEKHVAEGDWSAAQRSAVTRE